MRNNFLSVKERALLLAKNQRVSYQKFCETIRMNYRSFTGEAKKRPLNSDAVGNILREYPSVNPTWLLTGKGEMLLEEKKKERWAEVLPQGEHGSKGTLIQQQLQEQKDQNTRKDKLIDFLQDQMKIKDQEIKELKEEAKRNTALQDDKINRLSASLKKPAHTHDPEAEPAPLS